MFKKKQNTFAGINAALTCSWVPLTGLLVSHCRYQWPRCGGSDRSQFDMRSGIGSLSPIVSSIILYLKVLQSLAGGGGIWRYHMISHNGNWWVNSQTGGATVGCNGRQRGAGAAAEADGWTFSDLQCEYSNRFSMESIETLSCGRLDQIRLDYSQIENRHSVGVVTSLSVTLKKNSHMVSSLQV